MTDHYIAYCESQVRELRGERDRLAEEVRALRADLADKWQAGYDAGYDQGHADGYEARGRDGGAQ